MRIIKAEKSNSALDARTGGDPQKVSNYSCLDAPMKLTSQCGIFLGFGDNVYVIVCYKPKMKPVV